MRAVITALFYFVTRFLVKEFSTFPGDLVRARVGERGRVIEKTNVARSVRQNLHIRRRTRNDVGNERTWNVSSK